MARLIDADLAIQKSKEPSIYDLTDFEEFINSLPTVDAEPVRRGKWIEAQGIIGIDPETLDVKIGNVDRCSLCSTEFVSVPVKYKYCPNCGSIMRGDDYGKK